VNLSRDDLQDIVGHLVKKGVARIERLLEREGYSTASVELCLATGGMVNMPMVKNRLDELFGPGRVHVSKRSASAIAEGAAWVAHDQARLHLAKNVELGLARNSYMPLLQAGRGDAAWSGRIDGSASTSTAWTRAMGMASSAWSARTGPGHGCWPTTSGGPCATCC
jgi:hypothetical protein